MFKWTVTPAATLATLLLCGAHAHAYQFEGGVAYTDTDTDSAVSVSGEMHFRDVNARAVPLAEAAFLRNSNNLFASYTTFDDADVDVLSGGIELFNQGLYLAGSATRTDNGVTSNDFGVRLGFLPDHNILLTVGYDSFDAADTAAFSGGAKWVSNMATGTAVNLEGEISVLDDDDNTVIVDAAADYYFTRTLSAGVRITDTDAQGIDTEFGVGGRAFFSESFSGVVEYTSQDDVDTILIGLLARF